MIIKKPYAFLIKNFRIIHTMIFALLAYLLYKTISMFNFFSFYVKNHYYQYSENLPSKYINFYMFFAALGVVILIAIIFYLLKKKEKKRLYYIITGLFCIALFIFFIVMYRVFDVIQNTHMQMTTVRVIRDIMIIALIPQVPIALFALTRALGFNVKKFDFKKDLDELEIETSDNEEVEIILGQDSYKYARGARKLLRYANYIYKEKRFQLTVVGVCLVLVLSLFIFLNYNVYGKRYNQNEEVYANRLWFTVMDSYITKYDLNYNLITKGKNYMLIKLKISNKTDQNIKLDKDNFRINVGDSVNFPVYTFVEEFLDLGEVYSGQSLRTGSENTYLLVFELDEKYEDGNFSFRILNSVSAIRGEIDADIKDISLRPTNYNELVDTGAHFTPGEVLLGESTLTKSSINVGNFEIKESFKENYRYCTTESKCFEGIKLIKPDNVGRSEKLVMKIAMTANLDSALPMNRYLTSNSKVLEYFGIINYRFKGNSKSYKINVLDQGFVSNNYVFLEVPAEVKDALHINIVLQIRNVKYSLSLR